MTKLQAPDSGEHRGRCRFHRRRWTSVSSCSRSGPGSIPPLRLPNDNSQPRCSSSNLSASATCPPPVRSPLPEGGPLPSCLQPLLLLPLELACRPSPSSCPPFDYVIPPRPQSSNYIHSSLRLADSGGSNSVHLSLRTNGYDSNDRTTTTFIFSPFRAFLFSLAPSFFFPPSFSSFSFIHFAPLRLPSRSFSLEPRYIVHIHIYIVLATQASKRMYARCAIRFHLRPSRGGYSVSVLCPDFVRFSLRLDGACAARDWNGTSEFPRACYRMLHPAAPTGLSSSIIRTRGRSASDPSQCRAS